MLNFVIDEKLKEVLKDISNSYNIDYNELHNKYIKKRVPKTIMNTTSKSIGINDKEVVIFTDGSCINNGKVNSIGGIGVFFGEGDPRNLSQSLPKPTNQKAELCAILMAIKLANSRKIKIFTDSLYSINCVTKWIRNWKRNGWKNKKGEPVVNKDIIADIDTISKNKIIRYVHMNSHKREPINKKSQEWNCWHGNDMADKLAKNGCYK